MLLSVLPTSDKIGKETPNIIKNSTNIVDNKKI
jgi:hypothetical protein